MFFSVTNTCKISGICCDVMASHLEIPKNYNLKKQNFQIETLL